MTGRVYHYTALPDLRVIAASGVLLARPTPLYRDVLGRGKARVTPPVVWATANPYGEATIAGVIRAKGYRGPLRGHYARVALPEAIGTPYAEWTRLTGIPAAWWQWQAETCVLAGGDYGHWHVVGRDIPAAEWLACEVMADDAGDEWAAFAD